MHELVTCPTCGGSGVTTADDPTAADEQTLSDRDQDASDRDQTWSDQDQAASDSDSDSAADDQRASDRDLEAGGDPVAHELARSARAHAATSRDEVSVLRHDTAGSRVSTADERDRAAAERDRAAEERDRLWARHAGPSAETVAQIRLRAARDREQAAADRALAASDREAAARERAEIRRLQEAARHEIALATTDELTRVSTRKYGLEQITRELERATRTGSPLTLAFVDVDDLKTVNDGEGHAAGDRLLRLAASTMRGNLRAYDVIVRLGGDEFLCAMPKIDRAGAAARMASIAAILAAADTGHSISFGVAEHEPGVGLEDLVARADADLLAVRRSRGIHD